MLIPIGWISGSEWIVVALVILLLFGGTKIPQLMRGLGRGVGEFRRGIEEGKQLFEEAANEAAKGGSGTEKSSPKNETPTTG